MRACAQPNAGGGESCERPCHPGGVVRARRSRLALVAGALIACVAVAFLLRGGSKPDQGVPTVPAPKGSKPFADPFAWTPDRSDDFSRRASAGTAQILYDLSPGG